MFECEVITSGNPEPAPMRVVAVNPRPEDGDVHPAELGRFREMAESVWPQFEIANDLWTQIEEDALGHRDSDYSLVRPLESWSPLGLRDDLFQRLAANEDRLDELEYPTERLGRPGRLFFGDESQQHFPRIAMSDGQDGAVGATVVLRRSFVSAFPPGMSSLRVSFTATTREESLELGAAFAALIEPPLVDLGEDTELDLVIWWRTYIGSNTHRSDAISGNKRWFSPITSRAQNLGGVIVGTAALAVQSRKRPQTDPTRKRRLTATERDFPGDPASCPPLTADSRQSGRAVVAVHGTMACGLPLASALHELVPDRPIFRFEHDTWLPLHDNVRELCDLITGLGAESVTIIAHSRGGLVAEECARVMTHVDVITLGTPFYGTPLLSAVDVSLLGMRSLMGLIRAATGVVWVDAATYLAGFFIRGVPRGLDTMREDSDLSQRRRGEVPRIVGAVAGIAPPGDEADTAGNHFLRGIAKSGLMPDPHDLVVTRESAAARATTVLEVECDHFSYMTKRAVGQFITDTVTSAVKPDDSLPAGIPPTG
jgi:hypothetical protein